MAINENTTLKDLIGMMGQAPGSEGGDKCCPMCGQMMPEGQEPDTDEQPVSAPMPMKGGM